MIADRDDRQTDAPRRRVVLLGASNLLRSMPTLFDLTRDLWGDPLQILAAMGHGRSFGMKNRVLGRTLPGILTCGLWEDLHRSDAEETYVAITDVGNDILYDVPVERIAAWVETCLERLCPLSQRVILSELPLQRARKLGSGNFFLMRSIFFPRCRLSFQQTLQRAEELNQRLQELSARWKINVVKPRADWYGWDPIHIKSRHHHDAWLHMLADWNGYRQPERKRGSWKKWLYFRSLKPLWRSWFGLTQRQQQPVCALADGTTLSLY